MDSNDKITVRENGEREKTADPTATNQEVGLTPIDGALNEY